MLPDPGKGNNTALPPTTSSPPTQGGQARSEETKTTKIKTIKTTTTETTTKTKTKTKTETETETKTISEAGAFMDNPVPTTSISATATASTRTTSPTDSSVTTDTPSNHERWYERQGRHRVESVDNTHGFPIMKRVPGAGYNDHVSIYARSDPGNSTSNETETEHPFKPFKPYSLYFLTNCQWSLDNKTEHCTKPWDFTNYTILNGSPEDRHHFVSSPFLSKRGDVNSDPSEPVDEYKARREKVRKNRHGFAVVHLTGCVLVGLSFLSTATSFFILPALGQWISVGNLALATLATIFLLTSSIFTAVLAKQTTEFFEKDKFASTVFTAQSGGKLAALV